MKNKFLFVINVFFIFILYASFSFASYNNTGENSGNTLFNSDYISNYGIPPVYSAPLTNGNYIPLVSDINGDGIKDIIVNDGGTIKIYKQKTLTPQTSYSAYSNTLAVYSPLYTYDIDGDGLREIIIGSENRANFTILKVYPNLSVNVLFKASFIGNYTDGEVIFACAGVNSCMAVYTESTSNVAGQSMQITAMPFNSTDVGVSLPVSTGASVGATFCYPRIKKLSVSAFNGQTHYIFSAIDIGGGANNGKIFYVLPDGMNKPSLTLTITQTIHDASYSIPSANVCYTSGAKDRITEPLIIDAVVGGNYETILGYSTDATHFKMTVYNSLGASYDNHPSVQVADGSLISNPLKINAFLLNKGDIADKQNDYCVLGMKSSNVLDLLCGSQINTMGTPISYQTVEYFADLKNFNISSNANDFTPLIHAITSDNDIIDSNDADELMSSWGIYKLSDDDCDVSGCIAFSCSLNTQCKMSFGFENGVFNSSVIPIDAESVGYNDYLSLRPNILYYIDDRFTNSPPVLCPSDTDCNIRPCSNEIWILNTSILIDIMAEDDVDMVSYRATIYKDTTNEYSTPWSENLSSGTNYIITATANKTITNGIIQLQAKDSSVSEQTTTYPNIYFTVQSNGVNQDDCFSNLEGTSTTTNDTTATGNYSLTPADSNMIKTGLAEFNSFFNIGLTALWLLMIIIIDVYIVVKANDFFRGFEAKYLYSIIGLIDFMLILLGSILGVLPFWVLLLLIVGAIGITVLYISNRMNSSAGG